MVYINYNADKTGNHGNPSSIQFPGMVAMPESMMDEYFEYFGFVFLTVSDGVVQRLKANEDAVASCLDEMEAI